MGKLKKYNFGLSDEEPKEEEKKEPQDLNKIVETIENPSRTFNQGLSKLPTNPISGALDMVNGLIDAGFLVATVPLTTAGEFMREVGADPVADVMESFFELPAQAYTKGKELVDAIIGDKFNNQQLALALQMKGFVVTPQELDEITKSADQTGQLAATLLYLKGVHKGTKKAFNIEGKNLPLKDYLERKQFKVKDIDKKTGQIFRDRLVEGKLKKYLPLENIKFKDTKGEILSPRQIVARDKVRNEKGQFRKKTEQEKLLETTKPPKEPQILSPEVLPEGIQRITKTRLEDITKAKDFNILKKEKQTVLSPEILPDAPKTLGQNKKFLNSIDVSEIKNAKNISDIATRDNKNKTPAIRQSGFFATKDIMDAPIRNVDRISMSPNNMSLMQDGTQLGKGFGVIYNKVWLPTKRAIANNTFAKAQYVGQLKSIFKKHNFKITKQNGYWLSDMLEKKAPISTKHEGLVKDVRAWLDKIRDDANVIRKRMGKDEIEYIENYVSHMRKTSLWNEIISDQGRISENFDFIVPNQVKNPHAYRRVWKEMPNSERNFFHIADRYVNAMSRDMNLTPAIENIKAYNTIIKERGLFQASKYWDRYIRESLLGKQSAFDSALRISPRVRKALRGWKRMLNLAFLTGKFAWNTVTQPLSYLVPGLKEGGLTPSLKAPFKLFFNKGLRRYVKQESTSLKIKSGDILSTAVGEMRELNRMIYRTPVDKYNNFISMVGKIEEQMLHQMSFVAGLERGKKLGYKGRDIVEFADLVAERSQSMYNRENRAPILNSEITTSAFPFSSFSVEVFNHFKEVATKSRGAMSLTYRQRLGATFRLLTGVYLANQYTQWMVGYDKTTVGTFIPFLGAWADKVLGSDQTEKSIEVVKGLVKYATENDIKKLDEATQRIIKGLGKGNAGRVPVSYIQQIEELVKATKDYINHGSLKKLRKIAVNFGLAAMGVGGGGQLNNIIDGVMADIEGEVKDIKGKKLFEIEDTWDEIKAPIWGVWSTGQGKEYWEKRESPKPKKKKLKQKKF